MIFEGGERLLVGEIFGFFFRETLGRYLQAMILIYLHGRLGIRYWDFEVQNLT